MLEINNVYNCDCIDLMRAMKQQGIVADWLIADPPYGINIGHTGFYKAVPTKKTRCGKGNATQLCRACRVGQCTVAKRIL